MIGQSETELRNNVLLHKPDVLSVYCDMFFVCFFFAYIFISSKKKLLFCLFLCNYCYFNTMPHSAFVFSMVHCTVYACYKMYVFSNKVIKLYMFVCTYETINRFHRVSKIWRPVSYEFWRNYVPLWVRHERCLYSWMVEQMLYKMHNKDKIFSNYSKNINLLKCIDLSK